MSRERDKRFIDYMNERAEMDLLYQEHVKQQGEESPTTDTSRSDATASTDNHSQQKDSTNASTT